MDDNSPKETPDLPGSLKFLKALVIVLTLVMIGGVVTVVALLVMRLGGETPPLPDHIELPGAATAISFSQAADWYAVVTDADEILIFDRLTGELQQTVQVETGSK
ncbi:MAG: DUF6476 family protein [Marinovum sp.]|nr:DUF6476 family protein [Marinovum sp.]